MPDRQMLPKADAHMPDLIRVPRAIPDLAETSDWDPLDDDVLPYTQADLQDACRRAVAWREHVARSQGAGSELCASITYQSNPEDIARPDHAGWMRIGRVDDPWVGGMLRIFWHPASNRVQVDRPPQHQRILITSEPPVSTPTVTYVAVIRVRHEDNLVTLRARPQHDPGETTANRAMAIAVPQPKGQTYWVWAMKVASRGYNPIQVPELFPLMSAAARRDILITHAYAIGARIARESR